MGYLHIDNLYKIPEFLQEFEEVYVSEKVHGTSGNISLSPNGLRIFPGGEKLSNVEKLFSEEFLLEKYLGLHTDQEIILYGELYGGKCMGMSHTYGKDLAFIVFDVKKNDVWLNLPEANIFAQYFNQEFVPWYQVKNTLENLDRHRDLPSELAKRRGIVEDKIREGIVVKPLWEKVNKWGSRWIVKHKRNEFMETKTPREVDPAKVQILLEAKAVAEEWVTEERIRHVLDGNQIPLDMAKTGDFIRALLEDIKREAGNEIDWTNEKDINRQIGTVGAQMFKKMVQEIKSESV